MVYKRKEAIAVIKPSKVRGRKPTFETDPLAVTVGTGLEVEVALLVVEAFKAAMPIVPSAILWSK